MHDERETFVVNGRATRCDKRCVVVREINIVDTGSATFQQTRDDCPVQRVAVTFATSRNSRGKGGGKPLVHSYSFHALNQQYCLVYHAFIYGSM
jgi:hypothetical protein